MNSSVSRHCLLAESFEWIAKCRPTLTFGILTAVIVGRQSRLTALAVIRHHKIII